MTKLAHYQTLNFNSRVGLIILTVLLGSCVMPQFQQQPPPLVISIEPPQPEVDDGQRAIEHARYIADVLYEARLALDDDRLMLPAGDNAYERYQHVLHLEPDNSVVLAGIGNIARRYFELADLAMSAGEYDKAQGLLTRAGRVQPNNAQLDSAQGKLKAARLIQINSIVLNKQALSEKNTEIVAHLWEIARYIKAQQGTFLITARNDTEGRWIYRVMRESAKGYRLRGDITIGRAASVRVKMPLIKTPS